MAVGITESDGVTGRARSLILTHESNQSLSVILFVILKKNLQALLHGASGHAVLQCGFFYDLVVSLSAARYSRKQVQP